MSAPELINIIVQIHAITERAVLVSDDGEEAGATWLPLSHIELENRARGVAEITLPEWLAIERGLA
ncbi:hypothetical protein L1787_12990 [Acuticoccus sp. M5D2P5]|uniref:hypothetical protein n=1 Tax=Acuticoccus kalidii TaxID=2910977 RepID=UPI001F41AAEC|nr:hypothetical protein [Acuticoccus kalidii]MCF3934325.1 hypothetical protein [Acuticoccus kalidii]